MSEPSEPIRPKQGQLSATAQRLYLLSALSKQGDIIPECAAKRLKSALLKDGDEQVKEALTTAQFDYSHLRDKIMDTFQERADRKAQAEFNQLYEEYDTDTGKFASRNERKRKGLLNKDTNLVYGEVEFDSFVDILSKIDVKPGSKFLDLGSGTGKAVYAAAMLRDFAHVCGIEYLESLHNTAVKLLPKFEKLQDDNGLVLDEDTPEIVFHHGSFLDDRFDLSDYDVVFANSTCFDDSLMKNIADKCATIPNGAYVITFTRNLDAPHLKILSRKVYNQSWGSATCYIHKKVPADNANISFTSVDGNEFQRHQDSMSSPQSTALLNAKHARQAARTQHDAHPEYSEHFVTAESHQDSSADSASNGHNSPSSEQQMKNLATHHVARRLQHDNHEDGSASPQGDALLARKISQQRGAGSGLRTKRTY